MSSDADHEMIVGLEVHVQLLTQSKLFCGCSTKFGLPPNSSTCPICIGMPGVLPVMNRKAFDLALQAALALNCSITPHTKWDRKNYYYPDLPKNYQISQYDLPFSTGGFLEIETKACSKRIGLIRVHLEEDAGKMLHDESGRRKGSLVDLNRAGTPLLEIVSEPDMRTAEEAKAYLEELRLLLREMGVSDCEMQEGSLRVDANVNVRIPHPSGKPIATPIVEIKNLNSFRAVERSLLYEADRQYADYLEHKADYDQEHEACLRDKTKPKRSKATAGWDDVQGVTKIQRRKEEASDYRYFPEPDLVPIEVDEPWLTRVRESLPELPAQRRARFQKAYGLSGYDSRVLVGQGASFANYFETVATAAADPKAASNWCTNEVLGLLNDRKLAIDVFPIKPTSLADFIKQIKQFNVNKQRSREVFELMVDTGEGAGAIIKKLGLDVAIDNNQLLALVQKAIANNAKAVADFKAGKTKAMDALVGFVMRETKGKAPTDEVRRLMAEELAKS